LSRTGDIVHTTLNPDISDLCILSEEISFRYQEIRDFALLNRPMASGQAKPSRGRGRQCGKRVIGRKTASYSYPKIWQEIVNRRHAIGRYREWNASIR
tara:strand:+ start:115 stop:408 length:294 start_codon:yes stop_codon:yes gene_type:complete